MVSDSFGVLASPSLSLSFVLAYSLIVQLSRMNGYGHVNGAGPSAQPDTSSNILVPVGPTNQPKVLVRSLTDNEAVFHLSGVELGYANSVRRVIMADVPTVSEFTFCIAPSPFPLPNYAS